MSPSNQLSVGSKAPDFRLPDQDGNTVHLGSFQGQTVIVYFYPKDQTPGCTKEACSFRDRHRLYTRNDIVVLGVSPDSPASHQKFIAKYKLPFTLLSDPDHAVASAYGSWGTKKMYGKESKGILRKTFVIDEMGNISFVFDKVAVETHADDVLAVLKK